jgi:energy-coupling factor transporter transmembrane protein EcfT
MGKSQRQDPALGSFPWLLIVVVLRPEFFECSAAFFIAFSAFYGATKYVRESVKIRH